MYTRALKPQGLPILAYIQDQPLLPRTPGKAKTQCPKAEILKIGTLSLWFIPVYPLRYSYLNGETLPVWSEYQIVLRDLGNNKGLVLE